MLRRALNGPEIKVYRCRRNLITIECASTLILTVGAGDSNKGTGNKKNEKNAGCFEINLFLSLPDLTRLTGCFFYLKKIKCFSSFKAEKYFCRSLIS